MISEDDIYEAFANAVEMIGEDHIDEVMEIFRKMIHKEMERQYPKKVKKTATRRMTIRDRWIVRAMFEDELKSTVTWRWVIFGYRKYKANS